MMKIYFVDVIHRVITKIDALYLRCVPPASEQNPDINTLLLNILDVKDDVSAIQYILTVYYDVIRGLLVIFIRFC